MSTLRYFAFAAILSVLCACSTPAPPDPAPTPLSGPYVVREMDSEGRPVQEWLVTSYAHTFFPKKLVFKDADGNQVVLTKSFEVIPLKQP